MQKYLSPIGRYDLSGIFMQKKIEQRGKNTYLITVADGYDEKGKQIVKTKTIKTVKNKIIPEIFSLLILKFSRLNIRAIDKEKVIKTF